MKRLRFTRQAYGWYFGLLLILQLGGVSLRGQVSTCLYFDVETVSGAPNTVVSLPVRVSHFNNIASTQIGFSWKASALEFAGLEFAANPLGLTSSFFNTGTPGELRFAWYNQGPGTQSLADSTVIFILKLKVQTFASDFFPVKMTPAFFFDAEVVDGASQTLPVLCKTGGVLTEFFPQNPILLTGLCAQNAGACGAAVGNVSYNITGGSGAFSYEWTGPDGFSSTDPLIQDLAPGYYNLQVTDQVGQQAGLVLYITSLSSYMRMDGNATPTSCSQTDGCIHVVPIQGRMPIQYEWSAGGGTGQDICNLPPGDYTVTATDANGCTDVRTFQVTPGDALALTFSTAPANCQTGQTGSLACFTTNGQGPYIYSWNTAALGPVITNLFTGVYTVTVTDNTGCTGSGEAVVEDTGAAAMGLELALECNSANSGTLLLRSDNPSAIAFPLKLFWSNGSNTLIYQIAHDTLDILTAAPSGVYSVIALDDAGCSVRLDATLACFGPAPADSAQLVWPGDMDDNHSVNHHDLLYLGLGYGASGPARAGANSDWIGQPAVDWPQTIPNSGVNFKNLDTNGDGQINAADTLALVANWGKVVDPDTDDPFALPVSVPGMNPAPALSFAPDTLTPGQIVAVPVTLGDVFTPADDLSGLSFSISYNPKYMHLLYFEPLNSFLGDPANGLLSIQRNFPGQHRLDVALTRTDGQGAGGFGVIGRTFIVIEDDIFFTGKDVAVPDGGGGKEISIPVYLTKIRALNLGNTYPEIASVKTELLITEAATGTDSPESRPDIRFFPNPVGSILSIRSREKPVESLLVTDIQGKIRVDTPRMHESAIDLPVETWPAGVYLIQLRTASGTLTHKIVRQN